MDTKEMLEFAAKACGVNRAKYEFDMPIEPEWALVWNPLTDDGDCFRMECQLGIAAMPFYDRAESCYMGSLRIIAEWYDEHENDKAAARRMASTRVAAEIGRGME